MRTLRLSLIGMVILALLGGLPVVGQEDAEAPGEMKQATVMGEDVCSDTSCELVMDDPRVSGEYWVPLGDEMAAIPGGMVESGLLRLQGPDGWWVGPWVLTQIRQAKTEIFFTLEGSEAYAGWAFVGVAAGPVDGSPNMEVRGVIYEGSAPHTTWPQ